MFIKCPAVYKVQVNGCEAPTWDSLKLKNPSVSKIIDGDHLVINLAKEHCEEWFGKKLTDEFLENVYCSALEGDSLEVVLAKNTQGQILTRFYNAQKELVEPESITGPYDVIVDLHGINFLRKAYSPVWRILQVRERPKPVPEVPEEYLFEDDD